MSGSRQTPLYDRLLGAEVVSRVIEIGRRSTGGQFVHGGVESRVDRVESGLQRGFARIAVGNAVEENARVGLVPGGLPRGGKRRIENHELGVSVDVILARHRDPIVRPGCLIDAHERPAEHGPQRRDRFVDRLARLAEGARFADIGRQAEPRLSLGRLQRVVDPHQRQELPRRGGIERQSVEVRGGLYANRASDRSSARWATDRLAASGSWRPAARLTSGVMRNGECQECTATQARCA